MFFFFNDTATTEIYTYRHTLSLHDALPISDDRPGWIRQLEWAVVDYSLENLMTFPAVREAVDAGELTLHGAYFGVGTGVLFIRDSITGRLAPYNEASL